MSRYNDDLLAVHFRISKTREFIAQKYYWRTLCNDVEAYMTSYNIYFVLKAVRHKQYSDLEFFLIPSNRYKDLFIDFVTELLIFTNWKVETFNSIFVIIDRLINIVYYKPIKVTIDAPGLAKMMINTLVQYCSLLNSIGSD